MSTCSELGCEEKARALGLCRKHYQRVYRERQGTKAWDDRDEPHATWRQKVFNGIYAINELDTDDPKALDGYWDYFRMLINRYAKAKKQPNGYSKRVNTEQT